VTKLSELDTTRATEGPSAGASAPRIAITSLKPRDRDCGGIPTSYVEAVRSAGGSPFVVSPFSICGDEHRPDDLDVVSELDPDETSVLEWSSGLLLSGGGDVDPCFYGQEPHPRTYNVSDRRDRFEFNLLDVALERDMPVLAVCRGMQLLNVHLGGTLEQHLLDRAGRLEHDRDRPRADAAHTVTIEPGTPLARWLGEDVPVNSHHHQGVGRLAEPLMGLGRSEDGVLEAVLSRSNTWVVGVQWHPEAMAPVDRRQRALFDAFLEAARHYASVSEARSA
jgi:putative glutamine amidotransferase